ncbi:MAG: hypothetical protein HXX08_08510 [Chloroflexi bacterium]|uniref:Uncharacterized protein n=1 Tax=Candidatus Chlorohelix allophototropha TaxID=3003348 RepID=A0A8T7M330_9CHLR|nr:hypothetical protein [Chloroflexota bacterium]WJW67767.1 hypothetical protein OZ401_001046 [Chloroflexota bacterium L227-S17]
MTKRKLVTVLLLVFLMLLAFTTPAFAHENVGGDELAAADAMWIVASFFLIISGLGIIYSVQNGEFRNPEKTKRDMLRRALLDDSGEELDKYITIEEQ